MDTQHTVTYRRRGAIGRLSLCGVADIFEAADIHAAALRALGDMKAATVIVDCGELERTDLSTMQTMLALKHALESEHRTMRVSNLPDSQAAAWSRIGFSL